VPDSFLVPLERLLVLLAEQHPNLHPKLHYICYVAIAKVYVAVSRHVTAFPEFLSRTGQYLHHTVLCVGGVALWLERRSLASRPSLTCS